MEKIIIEYALYSFICVAALLQVKKSWNRGENSLRPIVIFGIILVNFCIAFGDNNTALRTTVGISGCLMCILALRYWYLAKFTIKIKESFIIFIILSIIAMQITGIVDKNIGSYLYIAMPILFGFQLYITGKHIMEEISLALIISQLIASTFATIDPENLGYYRILTSIVAFEMLIAFGMYSIEYIKTKNNY
jgi:hypothetical protein